MQSSAHAQNHKSCEYVSKSTTTIVNNVRDFTWSDWNVGDLAAFVEILAMFSLRMRRNGYLGAPGENSDIGIQFLDPDFVMDGEISAIWGRFQFIFFTG